MYLLKSAHRKGHLQDIFLLIGFTISQMLLLDIILSLYKKKVKTLSSVAVQRCSVKKRKRDSCTGVFL